MRPAHIVHFPDKWALVGAAFIMIVGIFVLKREHQIQDRPFSRRGIFRYR